MTQPAPDVAETEALFRAWEEAEAHVDLSDLRWVDGGGLLMFLALFGVVLLQFFTRYVLNDSYGWTEEIARYLLIGVCFVGSVMATRKGSHILVEAIRRMLPPPAERVVLIGIEATVLVFALLMTWTAGLLASRTTQLMVSVDLSKSVIYWAVAASFAGISIYAARRLIDRLHGRAVPGDGLLLD